jgi:hypothetical protein
MGSRSRVTSIASAMTEIMARRTDTLWRTHRISLLAGSDPPP